MTRSVAVSEPEWSRNDVAVLVASRLLERQVGPHGFPMSVAMDPANQFAFKGSDGPRVDWAEKAKRDAQDKYYKLHDTKDAPVSRNGHIWSVERKPTS